MLAAQLAHVAARVVCPQTVLKIQRPHWAATPSSSAAMPGSTVFTVFTVSATGSASASAAAMLGTRFHSCRSGRHRVSVMALSMALGTCAWELRPRWTQLYQWKWLNSTKNAEQARALAQRLPSGTCGSSSTATSSSWTMVHGWKWQKKRKRHPHLTGVVAAWRQCRGSFGYYSGSFGYFSSSVRYSRRQWWQWRWNAPCNPGHPHPSKDPGSCSRKTSNREMPTSQQLSF